MTSGNYQKHADSRGPSRIVIALNSLYARKLGTTTAAWLCQAEYTQRKAGSGCWWFKKILADRDDNNQMISPRWEIDQSFEYETGLTRSHQGKARKAAKKLGVLQERRSRNGGRLDYLLNLDLLAEIVSKWADEERNFQRSEASKITFSNVESGALESEISLSSTESIQIKKSRTAPSGSSAKHENSSKKRQPRAKIAGVHCWNDLDQKLANSIVEKYGEKAVCDAVSQLENEGTKPLPSVVEKILSRSSAKNMVEETRQRLDSYDISEIDRKRRTAARDAVDMLSPSERGKLIKKFIDENIGGDATSFEPITGEFRKLDEKLHCKRWLEAQFMGKF